ncbi:hypothetical protein B4098_1806 [Heyndrickxia coagulans]|uniref:Uncharacterized protein n=1 Tax=Heyndrickxia coagulans TaxID=1398 RepID=A0A150KA57_HEYCO|nr:hypothetical protein B4098_1806 [Heyndrickxia coagulans]
METEAQFFPGTCKKGTLPVFFQRAERSKTKKARCLVPATHLL